MNDNSDLLPNLVHEDAFEMQMRGYSRRQVDEFIARCRSQIRDLEQRLARALDDGEELRKDLATARQQALGAKPAHEEVSERIAQILKLADDEARSQKSKSALVSAKAQAKKALDEATARATAIHDGAERRLNLLSNRHSETIKRLTEILDGVSGLVAAETSRLSLEDEVDQVTAKTIAAGSNSADGASPAPANAAANGP